MRLLNKEKENMQSNSLRFTVTHIAKSHEPSLKPKLVKECVCTNARGSAILIDKMTKNNKGQLVINRTLSGPQDPAMSTSGHTP